MSRYSVARVRQVSTHVLHCWRWSRAIVVASLTIVLLMSYWAMLPDTAASQTGSLSVTAYSVAAGDTLWGYAQMITREGGSIDESIDVLMKINHLTSAQLVPGQQILVPDVL